MKYTSTRSPIIVSSTQAILEGLAKDGGLYTPEVIPQLNLKELQYKNYQEIATEILSLYFTEFSKEEIIHAVTSAYNNTNFSNPLITGLRKYKQDSYFLELFYGKTSAFKDQALSIYPYLLKLAMQKDNMKNLHILTATSGDTGTAAMEAISDVEGLSIAVLYPKDGISPIQKLQMQTQLGDNVLPLAIDGNFDEAQSAVKNFFLKYNHLNLSSANSINIARLIPQIIYYFDMFVRLKPDKAVDIYVPTGNFGNILAGYIAKEMGLPINKLVVCTNENNVLYDFFTSGVYDISKRDFKITHSPSMDILISSNLERLLYLLFRDKDKIKRWMDNLKDNKKFSLESHELALLQKHFKTQMSSNETTYQNIQEIYVKKGVLIDPHTATAIPQVDSDHIQVVVSTASPYKFPKLYQNLFELNDRDFFHTLNEIELRTHEHYPDMIRQLKDKEIRFNQELSLNEIEMTLLEFIEKGINNEI